MSLANSPFLSEPAVNAAGELDHQAHRLGFILTPTNGIQRPTGWSAIENGRWRIWHHPQLPVVTLRGTSEATIGWLLGHPIDKAKRSLIKYSQTVKWDQGDALSSLEDELYTLAGRFVLISAGDNPKVWPDAAGSLACFYSKDQPCVVSHPGLAVQFAKIGESESALFERSVRETGNWFPLGFSDVRGFKIVLPNHRLNVTSGKLQRIWPTAGFSKRSSAARVDDLIDYVINDTEAVIESLVKEHPLLMNLTAGRDSRSLLALSRPFLDRIQFVTNSLYSTEDVRISKILAERLGLRWALHEIRSGIPDAYQDHVYLPGFGGEVGRAFFWRRGDIGKEPFDAPELLRRMGYETEFPQLSAAMKKWQAELITEDRCLQLDLLYIEQRIGCTFSPVLYRDDCNSIFSLIAFAQRSVFEAMMQLPPEFALRGRLAEEICRRKWPHLLRYPFNYVRPKPIHAIRRTIKSKSLGFAALVRRFLPRLS